MTVDGDVTTVMLEDKGRAVHPCIVEVTYEDESKERKRIDTATWWAGKSAKLTFSGKAVEVVLDPDIQTIDADRDNNRWREKQ